MPQTQCRECRLWSWLVWLSLQGPLLYSHTALGKLFDFSDSASSSVSKMGPVIGLTVDSLKAEGAALIYEQCLALLSVS